MSIIQRIKKSHQYLNTVTKYSKLDKEVIIPFADEINDEGYIIRKSDKYVKQHSSLFCMGAYSDFIDSFGNRISVPVIVTDDMYDELSDNAKRFIVLHELGHFYLQLDKIVAHTSYKRNLQDECQADEYALNELGTEKTISALNEIKNVVFLPDVSKEMKKRIKNIAKKK